MRTLVQFWEISELPTKSIFVPFFWHQIDITSMTKIPKMWTKTKIDSDINLNDSRLSALLTPKRMFGVQSSCSHTWSQILYRPACSVAINQCVIGSSLLCFLPFYPRRDFRNCSSLWESFVAWWRPLVMGHPTQRIMTSISKENSSVYDFKSFWTGRSERESCFHLWGYCPY